MTILKKLKFKFMQDHFVDSFYKNLETLLSGYRIKSANEVYITHTVRDDKRNVIDVKFPTVHWGKLKWKFKGDLSFGDMTFEEQSQIKSLLDSRFDGLILKYSRKGVSDVYLQHAKELFLERLNRLSDDECPETLFEKVEVFYESSLRSESLEVAKKHRHQYNVNTELDLFYLALERLLGFERIRNNNNKGYKLVVHMQRNDEDGAVFPELTYVGPRDKTGNPRSVKSKKHWKSYSSGSKDAYRRLVVNLFDSSMKEFFNSGELDRYAIRGRELLLERISRLGDQECPKKVLSEVIDLYKKWFRLDKTIENLNHNIFSFDYLINDSAVPKSHDFNLSLGEDDDDFDDEELIEDLDIYINGNVSVQVEDVEESDNYDSKENIEALSRLTVVDDDFAIDLDD